MKEWMKNVRQVTAYTPGDQPDFDNMIKLNTNENPYPPAPGVLRILDIMDKDRLRLYPSVNSDKLLEELSEVYGFDEDMIFAGVGSDDVLAMSFLTFFNSDKPVLFPNITYSFYDVWAGLYRIPYETPHLDDNFRIVKEDYYKDNGGVVIANPNAPTSICEPVDFIEDIVKNNRDVVVIVDEAYIDFGGESALRLVNKYDNLLVVQTFSKSRSLAGMRIGFCIGSKELIKALRTVKHSYNSYTLNLTSILTGIEALKDNEYFDKTRKKIIDTREKSKVRLAELGFEFPDSKTNFIFAKHKTIKAKDIYEALKEQNIFVRFFDKPIVCDYLRISIGTDEEMETLYRFLKKWIAEYSIK